MGGTFGYGLLDAQASGSDRDMRKWSREAQFYSEIPNGVICLLCPSECKIRDGLDGSCKTRINKNNKLYTIAYGNPCAVNVDPIEKKPLLHFYPQSTAFSIGTAGCNFGCLNCQNWQISQTSPAKTKNIELFPEQVVEQAVKNSCISIAYTYNEPTTFYEYMFDTAKLARTHGIKNVYISNGFISRDPLQKLAPYLDGANIDLKSFDENIYLKLNGGKLQTILDTLKILKENKVWLEITNLVIPTWTDNFDMIKKMCGWLVDNGFDETPLHFSRFFPLYKLDKLQPTPMETLLKAREIAEKAGIKYIYVGNTSEHENTYCPKCKKSLVERQGYLVVSNDITGGKCKYCGQAIHGVWS